MNTIEKSKFRIDSFLSKLFILFLPLRMPYIFGFVTSMFGAQAEYLNFIIHFLGLGLFFLNRNDHNLRRSNSGDQLFLLFSKLVLVFSIISFVMSFYVYFTEGDFNGASPFLASTKLSLDFIQYILIIVYCRIVFSILSLEEVERTLHIVVIFLLLIGYVQILLAYIVGLVPIYNALARFLHFSPLSSSGVVCLTLIEPSHAAMLIGIVVLPFYLSRVLVQKKLVLGRLIELILWIPIIIMTKSSTAYIISFVELSIGLVWIIINRKANFVIRMATVTLTLTLFIFILSPQIIDSIFDVNFRYILSEKITDISNQSTNSRTAVLFANWEIFKRFPIIGAGNGLQGYFYKDYYDIIYGKNVDRATLELFSGQTSSIANGQLFIPALLSGYGIVGGYLFFHFIMRCIKTIINRKEEYGFLFYYYFLSMIAIIFSGFKSEFIGIYYVWFAFSIPMVTIRVNDDNRHVEEKL